MILNNGSVEEKNDLIENFDYNLNVNQLINKSVELYTNINDTLYDMADEKNYIMKYPKYII